MLKTKKQIKKIRTGSTSSIVSTHQIKKISINTTSNLPSFFYLPIIGILLLFISPLHGQKIKGMCYSGPKKPNIAVETFENIKNINANWVGLIPEATLDRATLKLLPDEQNNYWGETIEANKIAIQLAKKVGLKVFLKPHIVLGVLPKKSELISIEHSGTPNFKDKTRGAEWRGDFKAKNETDWQIWELHYEAYTLKLAIIAEELQVDLFSIGTELKLSAIKRPEFWRQLIKKVRQIYSGPLVYCANWDEYDKISFWDSLDYIGVDSYFPISNKRTPEVKKTLKNWKYFQKKLKRFSKKQKKKILLTEFGYRNVPFAGKRPWTHDKGTATINNEAQYNLYQAFFQTFWDKSWIAGGFAWKWFDNPKTMRATSFSVQGKPAMEVVKKWYEH